MTHLWFKSKTYGWGWAPATWQGWAVMLGYAAVMAASSLVLIHRPSATSGWIEFAGAGTIATAILIVICYKTGQKPHWRWGA